MKLAILRASAFPGEAPAARVQSRGFKQHAGVFPENTFPPHWLLLPPDPLHLCHLLSNMELLRSCHGGGALIPPAAAGNPEAQDGGLSNAV